MVMKQRGGTKQNQKGMLNVFQSTFSQSGMKQISRICICKTERTLQISGKCVQFKQSCLRLQRLTFVHENKAEKSTQWGQSSFKKSSALSHIKYVEVSLQIEFATLPPKPQPLCEMRMKRKMEKQGKCGHRLIVHSITRRGEIWKGEGGVCEVKR